MGDKTTWGGMSMGQDDFLPFEFIVQFFSVSILSCWFFFKQIIEDLNIRNKINT